MDKYRHYHVPCKYSPLPDFRPSSCSNRTGFLLSGRNVLPRALPSWISLGIGNCIVTDYDSGHGGEEAIYYSLAASGAMLLGMIFNVVGSFCRVPQKIEIVEAAADSGEE